jgi:four helix bundle protein
MATRSVVAEKAFVFAVQIVEAVREMRAAHKEYVLSRQLLRSGTSIGANIEEALAGQSRRDFIAKMSIASKEARETAYWLRLMTQTQLLNQTDAACLQQNCDELCSMLTSIVKTTRGTER